MIYDTINIAATRKTTSVPAVPYTNLPYCRAAFFFAESTNYAVNYTDVYNNIYI